MAHPDQGACLDPAVCGCHIHRAQRHVDRKWKWAQMYGEWVNTFGGDILKWNRPDDNPPSNYQTCPDHLGEYGTNCPMCEEDRLRYREEKANGKK